MAFRGTTFIDIAFGYILSTPSNVWPSFRSSRKAKEAGPLLRRRNLTAWDSAL